MLRIAVGEPLRFSQSDIALSGHAIEVRLNAEDPANNFMPFPGQVADLRIPGGPGVRFDSMLYSGYQIPPFYDSLLAKLVVWDEDRNAAIDRLDRALTDAEIRDVIQRFGHVASIARQTGFTGVQVHAAAGRGGTDGPQGVRR